MINWGKIIIGDSRNMSEIENQKIDLIITSPPYWHIKDYGVENQIGYGQTLHEYLRDLYRVWQECFRVLKDGRRLCINIGDQFARSLIYGRYKIIPLHSEIIAQCEDIGFDYMGSIIWQKKTTMNTSGGANVMGSYPYPPNGMVEIDYEFILIFKKPGKSPEKIPAEVKSASILTKEEWKEYFSGHWNFKGERQVEHEAMFPEELPYRLIKMFSFTGETVLDPFLGSGTTLKVALDLGRNGIGYEINPKFLEVIEKKLNLKNDNFLHTVEIIKKRDKIKLSEVNYTPRIKDASPVVNPKLIDFDKEKYYNVSEIISPDTVKLDSGLKVKFLGIKIKKEKETIEYLKNYILNKEVFLKFDGNSQIQNDTANAYVFLKNKIFVNAYLVKSGLALADREIFHRFKEKFLLLEGSDT
ncbi:DNA methyltransferase [Thermovenabulum gondwanense]|uniref:Methyltransferase n=1 Tax=Thermovenabulum gondwanense TaxID=520767 RepID=A0A162MUA6_9FIRM|nr:DNA methyltransferase [Thermovenabulum gondwanense]KYO67356.1 Modification methylase HindIII [Thermovenabulum gondwanense]